MRCVNEVCAQMQVILTHLRCCLQKIHLEGLHTFFATKYVDLIDADVEVRACWLVQSVPYCSLSSCIEFVHVGAVSVQHTVLFIEFYC